MVQPLPSFRQRAAGSRGPLAVSGRAWSLAPHASFPPVPSCAGRGAGGARPGQEWGPGARSFGAAARGSLRQLLPRSGGFGVIPLAGYTHGTGTCSVPVLLRGCALGAGCCSPGRSLGPHATPSCRARWCPGSGGPVPGAVVLCSGGRTHGKACREEPGASGELSRRAQPGWPFPIPLLCPCLQCPASLESCVRTTLTAGHVFPFSPNNNDSRRGAGLRADALVWGHQPAPSTWGGAGPLPARASCPW